MTRMTNASIATTRRLTLANGLRVLLRPDRRRATIGASVHYGVGFRTEPQDRTGFAHLFEHLMFQRGENPQVTHFREVEHAGGVSDGSTHQDYTDYYQHLPPEGLDLILRLEAERMRGCHITESVLRGQVDVVKEEIRTKVRNRPYGGFPWPLLPSVLYRTFPNTHDGFGCFEDLDDITPREARDFFDAYYTPENAVLTLAGNFDPDGAIDLVHRYFREITGRTTVKMSPLDEPPPDDEIRAHHETQMPVAPAVAIGYRIPDPDRSIDDHLAFLVLEYLLAKGPTARLPRRLDDQGVNVGTLDASCGFFGPLDARHPETFVITATHGPGVSADEVLDALDSELADLADRGPTEVELAGTAALWRARIHREHNPVVAHARAVGRLEILFGDGTILDRLPRGFEEVTADHVIAAARSMRREQRAVLTYGPARQEKASASPRRPDGRQRREPLWHDAIDTRLSNGMRVVAIPDRSTPIVEMRLHLPHQIMAGSAQAARLELLCRVILGGTSSSVAIEKALNGTGGSWMARREREWITFSGHAGSDHLTKLLRALTEALADRTPARYEELTAERNRVAALAEASRSKPGFAGLTLLNRRFFGPDVLAPPRPADLRATTANEVRQYHGAVIRPQSATLVLVGDFVPEHVVSEAQRACAGWEACSRRTMTSSVDDWPAAVPGIEVVHRAGAEQSTIALLATGVGATHRDALSADLANLLIGGSTSGRLTAVVRENRGLAYRVWSSHDVMIGRPVVQVHAATATAKTGEALRTLWEQLDRVSVDPPTAMEIATARQYRIGELRRICDSQASLATWLSLMLRHGRDPKELAQFPASLNDVSDEEIARMAGELFRPERFTGVVECDADVLAGRLTGSSWSWRERAEQVPGE